MVIYILLLLHYILIKKGKQAKYAWDDNQRKDYVDQMKGSGSESSVHVQRYKGLGEMNAEQLWDTTMNLKKIEHYDKSQLKVAWKQIEFSQCLMGDEVPPRREFIEQNAKYANIDA